MAIFLVKFFHILSLVIWLGSIIFFSFIGAPSVFKLLSKELAGEVVSDIFPKYYAIGYVCTPILLGSLLYLGYVKNALASLRYPVMILICVVACSFYSGLVVSNKARAIKMEIKSTMNEAEKTQLGKKFRKIHGLSMILNLFNLIGGLLLIGFSVSYLRL